MDGQVQVISQARRMQSSPDYRNTVISSRERRAIVQEWNVLRIILIAHRTLNHLFSSMPFDVVKIIFKLHVKEMFVPPSLISSLSLTHARICRSTKKQPTRKKLWNKLHSLRNSGI